MKDHRQFNLPTQASEVATQATISSFSDQQFSLPQQGLNAQGKDFVSAPNILQTAKAIQTDQGVGIGSSPDNNARMVARGQYYSMSNANGTVTSSATIDWSKGNTQRVGITQTTTLAFSNIKPGGRYILEVQQDETGSRAITWPASVVWPAGTAATASGSNKVDLYAFYNNGSSTFASSSLNY